MESSRIESGNGEGIRLGEDTRDLVDEFCYLGRKITSYWQ